MCNCEVLRLWPSRVLNLITILSALSTTRDVAGNEVQRSKPQTHSSASAQRKALHTLRQMLGYKIARQTQQSPSIISLDKQICFSWYGNQVLQMHKI